MRQGSTAGTFLEKGLRHAHTKALLMSDTENFNTAPLIDVAIRFGRRIAQR